MLRLILELAEEVCVLRDRLETLTPADYKPRLSRIPSFTLLISRVGKAFTRRDRYFRSMVSTWETLITDTRPRPDSDLPTRTFPGAAESARFDVMARTTTDEIRLSLKALD